MSAVGCFGRFTFSHLAFHIPTLAGSCLCLFCVVVCLVALFLCFWFLFCKCLGIPNSPRSLDLDDRQGLIARSAMQQKKKSLYRDSILLRRLFYALPQHHHSLQQTLHGPTRYPDQCQEGKRHPSCIAQNNASYPPISV